MMDPNSGIGGKDLPIASFRQEIVSTVANHRVTILTAETGAGKSTQAPQYLIEAGYTLVVTQPRILAAYTVAERVAVERGETLGETIGVNSSRDKIFGERTRCVFATDGLAMVRELMGLRKNNLLALDEVHEWNIHMEVLVAWIKLQMKRDPKFRVILMSATLEAEALAAYFGGAPVINVPGRLYDVTEQDPGHDIETDVANLVRAGRNVLVFQPGKREIDECVRKLIERRVNAEILPLHGDISREEQAKCFKHFGRPKVIVATNIAQTSVTIDDIDAVVDSGMERRVELVDGVEGLYLKPISFADAKQRRGRAGRTKPGIYIDHCPAREEDRLAFPKAEILRTRLDQTVLRLAIAGFDAEELEFFHQPKREDIHEAKRALKALGLMDANGVVTPKGHTVSKMPISVELGCMILEADRLGVVDDVLSIAAILEVNGITVTRKDPDTREVIRKWLRFCPSETESDVMAQLAVFKAARDLAKSVQYPDVGIHGKNYGRALEVRRHLAEAIKNHTKIRFGTTGRREDILRAVCAGMVDHLYRREWGAFINGDRVERELGHESVLGGSPDWIVGRPVDIQFSGKYGPRTLHLVGMATAIKPEQLAEIAPQLVRREAGLFPRYCPEQDSVVSTTRLFFREKLVSETEVPDPCHPEAADLFVAWMASEMLPD